MSNEREKLISEVIEKMKSSGIIKKNFDYMSDKGISLEKCEEEMRKRVSKESEQDLKRMLETMNKHSDKINSVLDIAFEFKKLGISLKELVDNDKSEDDSEKIQDKISHFMSELARENVGRSLQMSGINCKLPFKYEVKIEWLDREEWDKELNNMDKDDKSEKVYEQ